MKVRYHNVVTNEIRDVEQHSPEENLLRDQVTTVRNESQSLWITESEFEAQQDELEAEENPSEAVTFGVSRTRLTPGEVAAGIKSHTQKAAELSGTSYVDDEEEEEEPDDEEEEEEPSPPAGATARSQSSSGQRRRPARRTAGTKGSK